jgi:hypothetical protein
MKHALIPLFLLVAFAFPLFAHDEDGDRSYIPDYQELVREGYGPRRDSRDDYLRIGYEMRPMPTQSFYAKGYTIFYGYKMVAGRVGGADGLYAFGYPADFYHHLGRPVSGANLDRYVVALTTPKRAAATTAATAQQTHWGAVSTVKATANAVPVKKAAPLPAIGEKPAQ